ncbi:MAG TPA: large-conductance mechanosensitive channel protein MscL [Cyclobacteriaceae bacterium]|nr:large-conductance mechanosensitive channel protein MscL [Cyclobacteriaceae bacterium]
MLQEFKKFAMRGNVIDLAVGIIIGGAFGKIVSSLVNDIIMPPLGALLKGVDFKDLTVTIYESAEGADAVTLKYGMFLQNVVDFVIVAFAIFLLIKGINRLNAKKEEAPAAPPAPPADVQLLTEIRDLLKSKN